MQAGVNIQRAAQSSLCAGARLAQPNNLSGGHQQSVASDEAFAGRALSRLFANGQPSVAVLGAVAPVLGAYASYGLRVDLEHLLVDARRLSECAAASYLHANGFYKIVLVQKRQYKLRLHVWLPGAAAEENVHEHRWHFASTVVCGELNSEVLIEDVTDEAHYFDEYLYSAKDGQNAASRLLVGKTKLAVLATSVRKRGDCYAMRPNALHRIVCTGGALTATLMCQSAPARRTNRLLTRPGMSPDVEQRFIGAAELAELIQALLPNLMPSN